MRIAYRACARAWHHHPYDVAAFFKRQVVCGRMAAVLIRKWPKTGRIIGANAVTRSRVRERLTIGSRRRRIDEVERNFEHLERGVIEYAARYDSPSDSAVYPLLETVFRYGFLKGLATAWLSERAAKRMSAYWLANLVNDGIGRFGDELERRGRRPEIRRLTELLDVRLV
jgi:hypothetical protein